MKQTAIVAAVAGLVTTIACSTHSGPQAPGSAAPSQTPVMTEVTMTGCLVQGSGPTLFILENARSDKDTSSTPGLYLLMPESSVRLAEHLNHEVRIKGMRDTTAPPVMMPGERPDPRDLPRLTARELKLIADKCTTPSDVH